MKKLLPVILLFGSCTVQEPADSDAGPSREDDGGSTIQDAGHNGSDSGVMDSGSANCEYGDPLPWLCETTADCSIFDYAGIVHFCNATGRCQVESECVDDGDCNSGSDGGVREVCDPAPDGAWVCYRACTSSDDCTIEHGIYGPSYCVEGACRPEQCPSTDYCVEIGLGSLCPMDADGWLSCSEYCGG